MKGVFGQKSDSTVDLSEVCVFKGGTREFWSCLALKVPTVFTTPFFWESVGRNQHRGEYTRKENLPTLIFFFAVRPQPAASSAPPFGTSLAPPF